MVNTTPSRGTTNTQQERPDDAIIVEVKRDESLDAEVFNSMFAGEIHDALVSDERAWPEYPPVREGTYVRGSMEPSWVLDPFVQLLPLLTAMTAKKQGRRIGEKPEVFRISFLDQVNMGVKFVDSKFGNSDWILAGRVVRDRYNEDDIPEPTPKVKAELDMQSLTKRITTSLCNNKAFSMELLADVALASNNPWAYLWSENELTVCRFHKIDPEDRYLPAVHPGQVRVGVSYFTVPMLTDKAADPSAYIAWQHEALFQLPWYRDAPLDKRPSLLLHLADPS